MSTTEAVITEARMEADDVQPNVVWLSGGWVTGGLVQLERMAFKYSWPKAERITLDASRVVRLDTSGAWLLDRLVQKLEGDGKEVKFRGLTGGDRDLMALVKERAGLIGEHSPPGRIGALERLGRRFHGQAKEANALLSFMGEATIAFVRNLAHPTRIRWGTIVGILQRAGVDALPIAGLLSFLLGVVIAYQGGMQLREYGANIFIVELTCLVMIRELAPLITAIIIAGRTGSAYTAEIGTMKVTEEIDALKTLGIPPMDILVIPKVIGLGIAMPLLTVYACALGVFGGMVMAATVLDVSFTDFFQRIPEAVSLTTFVIGVGKAPVFALIVSMVGCFQGFQVSGGADSVGQQTTISVVQAIFLVIVADAFFSVIFSFLGI